mmetsp:Transcript_56693/g.156934  ORF Transcript_56693/g.156934 Transcript_56693/m.156934 type:complete len:233 (-) Transcript_56693:363-1061(-)
MLRLLQKPEVPLAQGLHALQVVLLAGCSDALRDVPKTFDGGLLLPLLFVHELPEGPHTNWDATQEAERYAGNDPIAHVLVHRGSFVQVSARKPCQERGHKDEAEVRPNVGAINEHVPPRPEGHSQRNVSHEDGHHPVDLPNGSCYENETQVQKGALGYEDDGPPMHVGTVLEEKKLPPHLKVPVVKPTWGQDHGSCEEATEAKAPEEHRKDTHGEHACPLCVEADDAPVCAQ